MEEPSDCAKTAAKEMERLLNSFASTPDTEYFVNEMLLMHRTLRQSFMHKVVGRFVQRMAENYANDRYDGRDEAACKACAVMWEALRKEYGLAEGEEFHLPLI